MTAPRLLAARWLLDAGAGASACRVLADLRGREANDLREASVSVELRPGIHALVVHEDGGLVFPLRTSIGLPRAASPDVRRACADALGAARAWFDVPTLPSLRLELEDFLAVTGTSLGLPAALAFVAHFAPASSPRRAVLATGRMDAEGRVLPVTQIEAKLAAAAAEQGLSIVLVPPGQRTHDDHVEVHSLAQAIDLALGPLAAPDPSLLALDVLIARARAETAPLRAIALLEAIDLGAVSAADRARVHLELGTALRHAGHTDAASGHHACAHRALIGERLVVGAETAERYELELWLTEMDQFRLDDARKAIAARLGEPFLSARNELRCRGMLGQIHAMRGDFAEAVRVREGNLVLHDLSDELAHVLPGTLCYLALDSARAGNEEMFERYACRLLEATPPGDATQWRYTTYALVRSLVALGRAGEAIAWAEGTSCFDGARRPSALDELLTGSDPILLHPEITTVRALARAYRRAGAFARAIGLGERVEVARATAGSDLTSWVAQLVELEVALAERDQGRDPGVRIGTARAALPGLHRAATEYHAGILTCAVDRLENELDRVFY